MALPGTAATPTASEESTGPGPMRRRVGLALGPLLFLALVLAPAPAGMTVEAWRVVALLVLMVTWWTTEVVPVAVTALLPVALLPVLGVADPLEAAAPYANPLIFLFLGGFMVALAMQRCGLHRRVALHVLKRTGSRPAHIVAGFMLAAAGLSMWVSNTATVLMLLPAAIAVADQVRSQGDFPPALLLGLAFGAAIGGMGTLIGSPPNALLAAYLLDNHGIRIAFAQWMLVGVPFVLVLLPVAWLLLTRVVHRLPTAPIEGWHAYLEAQERDLGRASRAERRTATVFLSVAALWLLNPVLAPRLPSPYTDTTVAVLGAAALFVIPAGAGAARLLEWRDTAKLPWGVLLLFGGGLSLAHAMGTSGLAQWLGAAVAGAGGWPVVLLVLAVVVLVTLLTGFTSNTATAATFIPVVAAVAIGIGQSPLMLAVPAALAASASFMLPVATPPNAIVYSSGRVSIARMARAGALLNLAAVLLVTLFAFTVVPWALGP